MAGSDRLNLSRANSRIQMIGARGQVPIVDFGLAALVDQVEGAVVRNGTRAYMAPEQLAGGGMTERSDVTRWVWCCKRFTGKRAFETRDRSAVPSAAGVIKDVDPGERSAVAALRSVRQFD